MLIFKKHLTPSALLYKLGTMGVQDTFFSCISYMYKHSKARLKIINKLSESFDILCGTKQGHPVSPELFKIYIHKLSMELNVNVPELNGKPISHLLWAEDIVLLARDKKSLQRIIEKLESYCENWRLEVSISNYSMSKPAIMIFNKSGRKLKESYPAINLNME